ncbi:MAG: hypothetical protein ACRETI_09165 [Steroidobacteraceae bacterium]
MRYQSCALALLLGVAGMSMAESPDSQTATAGDMRILEPYIGEFRSPTQKFDDGNTEYHHVVKYEWFDRPQTIAKVTISMVIPSQDRVISSAEGFYGFDSIQDQLYVFGAFNDGTSGLGTICVFNHETGSRTVCVRSMNPDGSVTHVRDSFEVVDENTWKNTTRLRQGENGEWKLVYEGIYTRIARS